MGELGEIEQQAAWEHPPEEIEVGEKLLMSIVDQLHDDTQDFLFGETDFKLEHMISSDFVIDKDHTRSLLEGKLKNGNTFIIDADLEDDNRFARAIFVQYPGGGSREYNFLNITSNTQLADANNPNSAVINRAKFMSNLGLPNKRPAVRREFTPQTK